jgi:hypothetical protein
MYILKFATVLVGIAACYRIYWLITWPFHLWFVNIWIFFNGIEDILIIAAASVFVRECFFKIKEVRMNEENEVAGYRFGVKEISWILQTNLAKAIRRKVGKTASLKNQIWGHP